MSVVRRSICIAVASLVGFTLVACSSDSDSDRGSSATSGDAGRDGDALAPNEPDPKGGRDEDASSCFATCSNAVFACQAGSLVTQADLIPDSEGCSGTLTTDKGTASEKSVPLRLHCLKLEICTGDEGGAAPTKCVKGSFSAFSFSYTPAGAEENVCIRE